MADIDPKVLFNLMDGYAFHTSELPRIVKILQGFDLTGGAIHLGVTIDTPKCLSTMKIFVNSGSDFTDHQLLDVLLSEARETTRRRSEEPANV